MTKKELLARLEKYPDDMQIMIQDGFNGGGNPREINYGPIDYVITNTDACETADCESIRGKKVIVIGFGCY